VLKVSEVRAMTSEQLTKELQTANRELFDLRLKASTKQLVNHREIPRTRRKIAVLQTIMRERELAGQ
jgi:large subunit ribosomal protein L29